MTDQGKRNAGRETPSIAWQLWHSAVLSTAMALYFVWIVLLTILTLFVVGRLEALGMSSMQVTIFQWVVAVTEGVAGIAFGFEVVYLRVRETMRTVRKGRSDQDREG